MSFCRFDSGNAGDNSNYNYVSTGLIAGHSYRWVIKARSRLNSADIRTTGDQLFNITIPAVAPPTATSPVNPTIYSSVPSTILFAWNKNNNAGLCDYIINLRDLTDNVLILDDNLGNAGDNSNYNYVSTGLIAGHRYRWVVKARSRLNSTDIRTTGDQLFNITIPAVAPPTATAALT